MKSFLILLAAFVVAINGKPTTPAQASDNLTSHNTSLPSYQDFFWTSVTYGNGKFVAVADDRNPSVFRSDTMPSKIDDESHSLTYVSGVF